MFKSKFAPKTFLAALGLIGSLVWLVVFSFPDNKLHLIFCDVGQGDAILIEKGFNQILIDGGPNDKVLVCLRNNMPFFDRKIEMVILTHPEADHLIGLLSVLDKYEVQYFLTGPEGNQSAVFMELNEKLQAKAERSRLEIKNVYSGEKIKLGEIILNSLWPEKEWVKEHLAVEENETQEFESTLSVVPTPSIEFSASSFILGAETTNAKLNDFSLVFLMEYAGKKVLFMGDADSRVQDKILSEIFNFQFLNSNLDLLKFPHHGSKTGVTKAFLEQMNPKEAIISVGRNSYGHPANEVLDLLKNEGVKVRRTDLEGEIKYTF